MWTFDKKDWGHTDGTTLELHIKRWKTEVYDRAAEIDPDDEEDWHSMRVGWALAQGMPPEVARDFSSFVECNTPYF